MSGRNLAGLTLALAVLCAGCAAPGLPPLSGLQVSDYDTAALRGKTIVLDPGHGGPERGAIAENGLCEAEVNLGVALYLWGFLKEAGALPILTRTSDTCLACGEPFVLRDDLDARAAVGNVAQADLFVSIHHNSDGLERGRRNDLFVFYKMSDPGCSLDAAREICAALQESLNASPAEVQPGNYRVLRETRAPAVLGEASYMNYKANSERLAYHRTLNTEAQGYFLGILRYYRKGVPSVSLTVPDNATAPDARPRLAATISSGAPGAAIDNSSIVAQLDGRPLVGPHFDNAGTVVFQPPEPLANGTHEFCLQVRNTAGNISRIECADFTVALPPARLDAAPVFPVIPADGIAATPIDVGVFDALGRPVRDGTRVELSAGAGRLEPFAAETVSGRVRVLLFAGREAREVSVTAAAGSLSRTFPVSFGTPAEALFYGILRDDTGRPVAGGELVRDGSAVCLSDAAGRVYDSLGASGSVRYEIRARGYAPLDFSAELEAGQIVSSVCVLQPVAGGAFFGRTVMLDPAGRSPALLPLLQELKMKIERAGGTAFLTWESGPPPPEQDRVMQSAAAQADLYISLAVTRGGPAAEHYYKSEPGERLAALACSSLERSLPSGGTSCKTAPGTGYALTQTSMPAVLLRLPSSAGGSPGIAQGLFEAVGEFFKEREAGKSAP